MILLNTKFCVSDDFDRGVFMHLVNDWFSTSKIYNIDISGFDIDNSDEFEASNDLHSVFIGNYETKFVFQLSTKIDCGQAVSLYVLDDTSETHMLAVQTREDRTGSSRESNDRYVIPSLMRTVFWCEYGGLDNDVLTTDTALMIGKSGINTATMILNGSSLYINPVVYISPYMSSGLYAVDYVKLARRLAGIAHVVVELNPKVAISLRDFVGDKHPFNGAVSVYFPNGGAKRFLPSPDVNLNDEIFNLVINYVNNIGIGSKFDPTELRMEHILSKLDKNSDVSKAFEDTIHSKDTEIQSLKDEVKHLKSSLLKANMKFSTLETGIKKSKGDSKVIEINVGENDLYTDEIRDLIIRVLEKEFASISDDSVSTRKYDILKDIIDNNAVTGEADTIFESFKKVFGDGTMTDSVIRKLSVLGFTVCKDGRSAHYHVTYGNDDRYEVIVSATSSDYRAAENAASALGHTIFCR